MKEMISVVENPEPILATSRCPPSLKKLSLSSFHSHHYHRRRQHDRHDHHDHHDRHDHHDHHHHMIIFILTASRCPHFPQTGLNLKSCVLSISLQEPLKHL